MCSKFHSLISRLFTETKETIVAATQISGCIVSVTYEVDNITQVTINKLCCGSVTLTKDAVSGSASVPSMSDHEFVHIANLSGYEAFFERAVDNSAGVALAIQPDGSIGSATLFPGICSSNGTQSTANIAALPNCVRGINCPGDPFA